MTLKGIKTVLVEENNIMTDKDVNKLVIHTALSLGLFGASLSLIIASIMDIRFTLLTLVLLALAFLWILDACCEDLNFLNKWFKFSKLWFINIILFIATFLVLKFFNFL